MSTLDPRFDKGKRLMAKTSRKIALHNTVPTSPLAALRDKHDITKEDVAALRDSDIGFGLRSKLEAEMVFDIERNATAKCRAWGEFLVEALIDFTVWDQRPSGALTEETALWLADQVGETPTPACLALLVAIVDEAHSVPAWFVPAVRLRASKVFGRRSLESAQQAA